MENKKPITFVFWIIAIILGITLFKQFDFQNLKFEKPALAVVYIIVFVFSVYYLIKNSGKTTNSLPLEYLKLNQIIVAANKQFLFLYNIGSCKILSIEEIEDKKDFLNDFYSEKKIPDLNFFPFAIIGRNEGVLLYCSKKGRENGIFYAGEKTKYPIKISNSFSNIIQLNLLGSNLLTEDEIYQYEEQQYNSNEISKPYKGILPLDIDIRSLFKKKFPNSILIDKNSDHKNTINTFLIKNGEEELNLPDGKYYSGDFEKISKKIRDKQQINFYHTHFIPSDFYGIGIYSKQEISELLKLGLINDDENLIQDDIYELLR